MSLAVSDTSVSTSGDSAILCNHLPNLLSLVCSVPGNTGIAAFAIVGGIKVLHSTYMARASIYVII